MGNSLVDYAVEMQLALPGCRVCQLPDDIRKQIEDNERQRLNGDPSHLPRSVVLGWLNHSHGFALHKDSLRRHLKDHV